MILPLVQVIKSQKLIHVTGFKENITFGPQKNQAVTNKLENPA
jgi:hypothetical protein